MNTQEQHMIMRYNAALILLKRDRKPINQKNATDYVGKLGLTIIAHAMQTGADFSALNAELPKNISICAISSRFGR